MGCGAGVARPTTNSKKPSNTVGQQTKVHTEASEVPTAMASLQGYMSSNYNNQSDEETKLIHFININDGLFSDEIPPRIECDNIVEFKINGKDEYDIIQVYKDGNDYYRVDNGYELLNIKTGSSENDRRIILSFALTQPAIELYFCIILSSQHQTILTTRKCPKINCEKNCLKIHKSEIKISLTDDDESQKIYLHKGDTIELEWLTKRGTGGYRIEEKKYCPISGGLYTVDQTLDNISNKILIKGKYSKTFNEYGMSFLFRFNDTNQIHDITACVINDTHKIKYIEITDNNIQPNIIWIEQTDWIAFEWNTKRKQTIVQIEPFLIDENKQQSIELKTPGEHFFWPNEPSRRGFMYHQFNETGIYCYKTGNNQIGTIIVEPHKIIYRVPIFSDQLIHKLNTKDLVQFDWKMNQSEGEPVLITIDSNSSVVPDAAGGLTGIFDCAMHKCTKVEPFFRHHFHTCETFLLNIPQHGLYNFAYSDNHNNVLISLIIENGIDNHRVVYNEQNIFEPHTLIINRFDQVWFDSSSSLIAGIYQTDEYGNRLESEQILFHPQENSINYFMKNFQQLGIYYYSTDINYDNKEQTKKISNQPLAIIVIPELRFHYKSVRQNDFDSETIITNVNDFIIWQFENIVAHNVIQLHANEKLQDLISCHQRSTPGKNRLCLAVECIMPGTYFFANPEFERITGSEQERLISTIIIDPPFSHNCFITTRHQFTPNVLYIAQNDTVSWTLANNEGNHRISVQSNEKEDEEIDDSNLIHRNIIDYVHDVYHLHTFHQPGQYTIRSDRFQNKATVFVYTENAIRSQKRRVQDPQILEPIEAITEYGSQIRLTCPNRNANIYYTLDGSIPTRHYDNVHEYDPNEGLILIESGLHVIRAYATEEQKLSSSVITSSPTFVMENKDLEALNELRALWNSCKLSLIASLQQPNKLYGNIEIEPTSATDLIDHFEIYINDVPQKINLLSTDVQFSAEGFAGGEQYEMYILAYPKLNIIDVEPIPSNKRAFEIKREIQNGGPLVSLAISNDQNTLILMWAHIGDHVSEYIVYVDNIENRIIPAQEFNDFYAIQFHSAQHRKTYLLHVEAKLKNNNEIRKSNIISVTPPIDIPIEGPTFDRYHPYIKINSETTPSDTRLEKLSDRLSSPKLLIENSSSSLPSSSTPPSAASSRPSIHVINLNNTTLNTSENISQKTNDNDETNKLKEQQQQQPQISNSNDTLTTQITLDEVTTKPKTKRRKKKSQQQNEKSILSNDSKYQAEILLEKLKQAIENRSNHTHLHTSFLGIQHYKTDQRASVSSNDPYTDKLPPKSQRHSSISNKNFNQNDNTTS